MEGLPGTVRPPFPAGGMVPGAKRPPVVITKRLIEAMSRAFVVAERFIIAIAPVPIIGTTVPLKPIAAWAIAVRSPVRVGVNTESLKIAIRIIIVPVVGTRIARANTHAVMHARSAAAHQRTDGREKQDPEKPTPSGKTDTLEHHWHKTGQSHSFDTLLDPVSAEKSWLCRLFSSCSGRTSNAGIEHIWHGQCLFNNDRSGRHTKKKRPLPPTGEAGMIDVYSGLRTPRKQRLARKVGSVAGGFTLFILIRASR